jgi:hypothetical protein
MADYVQRITLRVLGVDLDDVVVSCSEKDGVPTKTVNTMNKAKTARGFKQANSNYSLQLDAEQINDPTVPDWHVLKDKRTRFVIVKTPDVGVPVTYEQCVVTDVDDSTSDGDSSVKVSVLALRRKKG